MGDYSPEALTPEAERDVVAKAAQAIHALTCRASELKAACDGATSLDFELARSIVAGLAVPAIRAGVRLVPKADPLASGHDLARQIIGKHGADRYPSVTTQALKVAAEAGELADAILKHDTGHDGCPRDVYHGSWKFCPHVRKEYADAGLALYALGDKLGMDLIDAMRAVVEGETRRFAEVPGE